MKQPKLSYKHRGPPLVSELLLLPDGRILAHNLTVLLAELLQQVVPDAEFVSRANSESRTPTSREQDAKTFP